ncbi:HAD-IA family hydrolase [Aquicoccus porphyridii]|uniref:HAD-IA family hydrolase n=1 Tax=Aquicoccus porphyridii TaxID=1852029 RepID=UPI00273D9789|nr:HAD-IA family hydrolase [Aquicoccus porphyridii]
MTPKALIFDVDGTLAETEEAHREAFNRAFTEAGLDWNWSVEDYGRLLKTTGGKERMRRHRDEIGADGPDDETIAALHLRKTELYAGILASGELVLRPGVADLIAAAAAAGVRLAVATTTNLPNVEALCRACWGRAASEVFEVIAAGDEVAAKKPAPDVFLLSLERLGLPAGDCIAFEDSLNGLRSARGAGLRVAVTPSAYTADETFAGAEWVLPDLLADHLPPPLKFDSHG